MDTSIVPRLYPRMVRCTRNRLVLTCGHTASTFGCSRRGEFDITCMRRLAMAEFVKREPKKPYSKPTLTLYGTVRELTQKVGQTGNTDGGTFPPTKVKTNF